MKSMIRGIGVLRSQLAQKEAELARQRELQHVLQDALSAEQTKRKDIEHEGRKSEQYRLRIAEVRFSSSSLGLISVVSIVLATVGGESG